MSKIWSNSNPGLCLCIKTTDTTCAYWLQYKDIFLHREASSKRKSRLFCTKQTLWHFEQISGAQNEDKTCASSQPDVFCIMGQTIVWRSRISTGPLFRIVTLYNKALKSVASIAHLNNDLLKKWDSYPIVQLYNICAKSFASVAQIHTDCTIYKTHDCI